MSSSFWVNAYQIWLVNENYGTVVRCCSDMVYTALHLQTQCISVSVGWWCTSAQLNKGKQLTSLWFLTQLLIADSEKQKSKL